jgi:hypothetical protein
MVHLQTPDLVGHCYTGTDITTSTATKSEIVLNPRSSKILQGHLQKYETFQKQKSWPSGYPVMNLEVKIIENLHFLQIHIDELYHAVPIELMAIENHFDGEK